MEALCVSGFAPGAFCAEDNLPVFLTTRQKGRILSILSELGLTCTASGQALNTLLEKLKALSKELKREIKVYRLVLKDNRTPRLAKFLLGLAVGYALLPFDIIPDFIPVVGQLDDLIIVPVLVVLALKMIPKEIIEDSRKKA